MLKRRSESLRRKIGWSHGLKVSSPKYLFIALLVLTCTCVHQFFDASPSRRCSWMPLFPVSVGWTWVTLILPNGRRKVVISRWRSPACFTFATGTGLHHVPLYPPVLMGGGGPITSAVFFPKAMISAPQEKTWNPTGGTFYWTFWPVLPETVQQMQWYISSIIQC